MRSPTAGGTLPLHPHDARGGAPLPGDIGRIEIACVRYLVRFAARGRVLTFPRRGSDWLMASLVQQLLNSCDRLALADARIDKQRNHLDRAKLNGGSTANAELLLRAYLEAREQWARENARLKRELAPNS
jgi:hypothetical protein